MSTRRARQPTPIDPAFFARICLDDELFGPARLLTRAEIEGRLHGLRGPAHLEAMELLSRRLTRRHRRSRARVDALADLHTKAAEVAVEGQGLFYDLLQRGLGVGRYWPPHWEILAIQERRMRAELSKLRDIRRRREQLPKQVAEQIAWYEDALARLDPVWEFIREVNRMLRRRYPGLGTLPWTADWILRLAQDRPRHVPYAAGGPRLVNLLGGEMVRTLTFVAPPHLDVPAIEVDWSESREEVRQRLQYGLEQEFFRRFRVAMDIPSRDDLPGETELKARPFRGWLKRNRAWAEVGVELENFLDETHPPDRRPYTTDPLRQVRRDVSLWVGVKIGRRRALVLAEDYQNRFETEPDFRAGPHRRRSRLPTTEKGIVDAVSRADRLLRESTGI